MLCIKWFSTLSVKIQNCSLGHEWVLRITSTVLLLFSPSSSPLPSCGSFFSWTCLSIFYACLWVFSILSLSLLKLFCKLVVPIYIPMSNINSSITPQPHQYFDIMNVFNFKCYNGACRDFVCVCVVLLMTNDVEHFFMWLVAICISPLWIVLTSCPFLFYKAIFLRKHKMTSLLSIIYLFTHI